MSSVVNLIIATFWFLLGVGEFVAFLYTGDEILLIFSKISLVTGVITALIPQGE